MRQERGGAIYGFLAAIGFFVVVVVIAFAVCTGSAGAQPDHRPAVERHQHRGDCRRDCRDERGQRGDRQVCFAFCDDVIIVPTPWGNGSGGDQQPPAMTASLVPPTPDKIIKGIQALADGGITLGTTIAKLVTDYVVTVFRFVA